MGRPNLKHLRDSNSNPEESEYLKSYSKMELIAMVQREMESLKYQIECLTGLHTPPVSVCAMADPGWWKLTFSRKKSEVKVLYKIPPEYGNNTGNMKHSNSSQIPTDNQFSARLEKIVYKSATKGSHVKVSHSGRFKKIRATLAENPTLSPEHGLRNN